MSNTTETLWKAYDNVTEMIQYSDTKAGAILATNGIIAGVALSNLTDFRSFIHQSSFFEIMLGLGIASILVSTFFALRCLTPSIRVGKPTSLIYFGHIAQKYDTHSAYEKAASVMLTDEAQIISQISQQVWVNSQIAWKKFNAVTYAIYALGATIIIAIVGAILALI